MKNAELKEATAVATDPNVALLDEDISIFNGYGLPYFSQIVCTSRQLAALIRWQCVRLDGTMDTDALTELNNIGRRKFTVVN